MGDFLELGNLTPTPVLKPAGELLRPYVGASLALHFASPGVATFMAQIFAELARAAGLQLCGGHLRALKASAECFRFLVPPTQDGTSTMVFWHGSLWYFYCSTHPLALDMRNKTSICIRNLSILIARADLVKIGVKC